MIYIYNIYISIYRQIVTQRERERATQNILDVIVVCNIHVISSPGNGAWHTENALRMHVVSFFCVHVTSRIIRTLYIIYYK